MKVLARNDTRCLCGQRSRVPINSYIGEKP